MDRIPNTVLAPAPEAQGVGLPSGILAVSLRSDGTQSGILACPGSGTAGRQTLKAAAPGTVRMDGRTVFKLAVKEFARCAQEALNTAGCELSDVTRVIPHQANIRIIEKFAKDFRYPMDQIEINLDRYGNTSSASIPIALDEAARSGRIVPGDLVLILAAGAGFSSGAILLRM